MVIVKSAYSTGGFCKKPQKTPFSRVFASGGFQ